GHAHHQGAPAQVRARARHDLAHRVRGTRGNDHIGLAHRRGHVGLRGEGGGEGRARQEHVVDMLAVHALHDLGLPRPQRHRGTLPLASEQVRERRAPGAAADDGHPSHTAPLANAERGTRNAKLIARPSSSETGRCDRTAPVNSAFRTPHSAFSFTQPRPFSYETDSPSPAPTVQYCPGARTRAAAPARSPPRACRARPARRDAPTGGTARTPSATRPRRTLRATVSRPRWR